VPDFSTSEWLALILAPVLAGSFTAALIVILSPWLQAYALARPNARSSHKAPTPQGGGAAVVLATLVTAWAASALGDTTGLRGGFAAVTAAAGLLCALGAVDDIRSLGALPRLILQCVAVAILITAMPADLRIVPFLPWWLEHAALFLGCVWFVNLTNFMDGIDWMTVAESVPVTAAIALAGSLGHLPWLPTIVALALLGAMLGFAPFNRPVAKLFLGDVGSLPIGLLLAWLLLQLAAGGHLAAALILPLYYLADATLTLLRRLIAGEPVWQAHRSHFYQRALDRGFTVPAVIARVFAVNVGLAVLALLTVFLPAMPVALAALAAAAVLVGWLLVALVRGPGDGGQAASPRKSGTASRSTP
jgi:UDP-N-acetylmuramyl pentapeptide phosphotransferase/UDP-N-acetylglucosamine-1-phosphate transferase